ncbi:MAG: hypothetical protein QM765_38245 [Myxococcales bacterium]
MTAPLALLLLAGLQAAPAAQTNDVAVLLTRRVDLARLTAGDILEAVSGAVEKEQLAVLPAAKVKAAKLPEADTCAGKKACVLDQAKKLGAAVVVGVQVGSVGSSAAPIAVYVEALRVSDGASLADLTADVQRDSLKEIAGIGDFAKRLREALGPVPVATSTPEPTPAKDPEPKPATDSTKVVLALTPPPPPPVEKTVPPEALGTTKTAAPSSHTAGYAMVGITAAAAVGAIACLSAGLAMKSEVDGYYDGNLHKVNLTRAQAEAKVPVINALLTTSIIAGVVAAGAGTTAAIVW